MVNNDYKNAVRIFEYVIETYPGTPNYQIARRLVIGCREEIVKNTFPVEDQEIRTLINDYGELIKDIGLNQNTIEAMRSQALLYAFYLNDHDSAIMILQKMSCGLARVFTPVQVWRLPVLQRMNAGMRSRIKKNTVPFGYVRLWFLLYASAVGWVQLSS